MPPKRKSDVTTAELEAETSFEENGPEVAPLFKKARVSASSGSSSLKAKPEAIKWQDVELDTNPDSSIPVYDDCAEVRRKIKLLQSTAGWKVGTWLREIGGINNNSFNRFMKEKGRTDGATNGTYLAAYVYFEKVRIAEGKKKTAGRQRNESEHPTGFPLENRRRGWVFTGRA
ncbi:hypothetical protein B0H10DRAFT_420913 [Mycena sp. CBHHK59/15]|nr:hypothetical protein B0H10DRAFT_420913 [Mycena sp. CBHHK59/15]